MVQRQYWDAVEKTNCTPKQFFLDNIRLSETFRETAYTNWKQFEDYFNIKQTLYGDGAEDLTMEESLEAYLTNNPIEKSGPECLEIVSDAGHRGAL